MSSPARWAAPDFGIGELFSLISDAIVIGDANSGRIVLWNEAAEQMFGYTADEAHGMKLEQLVPEQLRDAHNAGIAKYASSGRGPLIEDGATIELPALRRDGSPLQVELRLSALRRVPEQGSFVLAIIRDVSVRHRIQQELIETAARLEGANDVLRDFVSMAAHDLKTPLTVIIAALETLSRDPQIGESQRAFVDMAVRQSRHLDRLIEALLLLARLDAGSLEPHPQVINVADALTESLATFPDVPVTVAQGLDEIHVLADDDHLRRILVNFLSNAARHGQPPILVDARVTDDEVVLSVQDHGPGVPDELIDSLFDRFTRGASRDTPGTGLGLSIARGLARANGGDTWYEHDATGHRFCVRLSPAP